MELLHCDRRFTNMFGEVHTHLQGSSGSLFFLDGNHTHRNHSHVLRFPKSASTPCNRQWYDSANTRKYLHATHNQSRQAYFKMFMCRRHNSFCIFMKLILNRLEFGKLFNMKNLRLTNIFQEPYHLYHFEKWFGKIPKDSTKN
jgi:hypothetical protein